MSVFSMSMAMVIGPTPPGTGVIIDAFAATSSNSASPPSFPWSLFIATSITTAPSLTISRVSVKPGRRPTAVTSTSACLVEGEEVHRL